MANQIWLAKQIKTAQVNTITVGGTDVASQVYTVTINGKKIQYTSTGAGNNANAAGLQALLAASTEPEFLEVTWTVLANVITGTAKTAGYPFTNTSSATGTGTLVTATTVANTSPNDVNDGVNWSTGSVPTNGDTVFFDGNANGPALYNLGSLSAVTLAALNISQAFTYQIGLPPINSNSTAYAEYRAQYFAIGATTCTIGYGQGTGSQLIRLDFGGVQTACTVLNTGSALITNTPTVDLNGTNASNTLTVDGGSVGSGFYGGKSNVWSSLVIAAGGGNAGASPPTVLIGQGTTLTTVTMGGGTLTSYVGCTTFTEYAGTATFFAGSITTAKISGSFAYLGTGTIGTLTINSGASVDFSLDPSARTVTNCSQAANSSINDPAASVTFTNAISTSCDIGRDCSNVWGKNRAVKPS